MTENSNKSIGNRIRAVRVSLGLTMEEFGKKFQPKADKSLVSRWEKGVSLPNNERLKRIADLGKISMPYLLEGKLMLKDIGLMPEKKHLYDPEIIFTDEFSDGYFEFVTKEFSNSIRDKYLKTQLAALLKGLIEINEKQVPAEQLEEVLRFISSELSEIPYKIANNS